MKLERPALERNPTAPELAFVFPAERRLFTRKQNHPLINGRHLGRLPLPSVPPLGGPHK